VLTVDSNSHQKNNKKKQQKTRSKKPCFLHLFCDLHFRFGLKVKQSTCI